MTDELATDLAPSDPPHPVATLGSGFLMGCADIVPGVSGGTIALVLGIYERLVAQVRAGAGALARFLRLDVGTGWQQARDLQWRFLLPLLAGILVAIASLSALLERLLEEQPVLLSGLFLGLVAGSVVVARREFRGDVTPRHVVVGVVTAVVVFVGLGFRTGGFDDPALAVLALGGAIAVCAMILPGISGSFLLLLMGLYEPVIRAISARDLVVLVVVAAGAGIGLGLFSTFLNWLLATHHDVVLAALIGLMAGSLRVLWPWPRTELGIADTSLGAPDEQVLATVGLMLVGVLLVVGIAWFGNRFNRAER
jgi:putative membrane protein